MIPAQLENSGPEPPPKVTPNSITLVPSAAVTWAGLIVIVIESLGSNDAVAVWPDPIIKGLPLKDPETVPETAPDGKKTTKFPAVAIVPETDAPFAEHEKAEPVPGSNVNVNDFASAVNGSSANAAGHVLGLATLSLSNGSEMDNAVAGDYFRLKFTYVSGTFAEDFELHFIEIQEQ